MNIVVEHDSLGRLEVGQLYLADHLALERTYGISAQEVGTNPRVEHVVFLAWNALRREGKTSEPFDTFVEGVVTLDTNEGDDAVPPTDPPPGS